MTGPLLTTNELAVLTGAAAGHTYAVIGHRLGLNEKSIAKIAFRAARKLGARNITNAVWVATLAGVIGRYPDCGDRAAYLRHLRRRETPCPACRGANARHGVEQRAGRLRPQQAREGPQAGLSRPNARIATPAPHGP